MTPHDSATWMLVSDVDDTLFGHEDALARFAAAIADRPDLLVCLNSSRPIASIDHTLAESSVDLRVDATIGAMGTEMRIRGEPLSLWSVTDRQWSRQPIDEIMTRLGFEAHREEFQTPLKASFRVPHDRLCEVAGALHDAEVPARVISSGQDDLDILPPGGGKGAATVFIAAYMNVGLDRLVVSGDSANDFDMFDAADRGIVVGNARAELRERVDPEKTYFARQSHADGVLEGLQHWGALAPALPEYSTP